MGTAWRPPRAGTTVEQPWNREWNGRKEVGKWREQRGFNILHNWFYCNATTLSKAMEKRSSKIQFVAEVHDCTHEVHHAKMLGLDRR